MSSYNSTKRPDAHIVQKIEMRGGGLVGAR